MESVDLNKWVIPRFPPCLSVLGMIGSPLEVHRDGNRSLCLCTLPFRKGNGVGRQNQWGKSLASAFLASELSSSSSSSSSSPPPPPPPPPPLPPLSFVRD